MLGTPRLPLILVAAGDPSAAAGTNIAISAAAAGGGYRHASEGRVDWAVVRWMTPPSLAGAVAVLAAGLAGALPGAWAGSRIAGRASELVCGARSASRCSPSRRPSRWKRPVR